MKFSWQKLRTVPGQMTLMGIVFFCAVVLGIFIVCLRGIVFERYSRETYLPLEGYAEEAIRILSNPESTEEQVTEVSKQLAQRMSDGTLNPQQSNKQTKDLERIYGAWIRDDSFDASGYLVKRLTRVQTDWVFERLRVTLVAGSPAQQARALAWLRLVAVEKSFKERIELLAGYARRKAERRGDRETFDLADAVLALGGPRDGIP